MADDKTQSDPGAELAIRLLDKMISNGASDEMVALGEGVKASIQVSCNNNIKISKHIDDDDVHTFLGIVKQEGVLKWLFGTVFTICILVP